MPSIRYIPLCTPVPEGGCDAHGPTCLTPGKRPLEHDWKSRWYAERWRLHAPPCVGGDTVTCECPVRNAGVLTGPDAGLLVLDIDSEEALTTYASWGLPYTFMVRSGRESGIGRHYYFRWPEGLARVPDRLDGIEVKGPGRQVVAWDSLHASGRRYEKFAAPFAELPPWFVERLRAGTPQHNGLGILEATPAAQERLEEVLKAFPDAVELADGNWEATCPAHDDQDPSLVVTASENRLLVHCRAGCSAEDVVEAAGFTVGALWTSQPLRTKRRLGLAEDLGTCFRLPELMKARLPGIRWAVPGMVPDGLTLLAGPPKLGKSWLVLDLAIQVAGGGTFLEHEVEAGEALYLALEDNPRRLQGRAERLLGDMAPPAGLEIWTRAGKLGTGLIGDIEQWLDGNPEARLVIIDTLGRVQDPGNLESKDGGYADAVEALVGLQDVAAARSVAVVVVTHTKKGGWTASGDPLEAVLGSQGYAGTADSVMVLKRERGEPLGQLFVTGREVDEEMTYKVRFDEEQCRWLAGHEMTLSQEIVAAVTAKPLQLTSNGVAKAVGRNKRDVLDVLAELESAGVLRKLEPVAGGWAKWSPMSVL